MPFGSYEISPEQALTNAYRFLKECGMDAVKLEGGRERAATVAKIVQGGVAVMGHIGLTPQAISVLGGFRAQGRYVSWIGARHTRRTSSHSLPACVARRTAAKARALLDDALALQAT